MRASLQPIALLALIFLCVPGAVAQSSSDKCPIIVVSCPAESVWTGTPITFRAQIDAPNPTAKPEFKWVVSAGTITTGQGTETIVVNTDDLIFVSVKATVQVSGLSTTCETQASCATEVINCGLAMSQKFDEFGTLSFEDEKARLDNFAIQIQNLPGAQGYIFVYRSPKLRPGMVESRLKRAKDYLVQKRHLDPGRIVVQPGGSRKDFFVELFVVPVGATPPMPEAITRQ